MILFFIILSYLVCFVFVMAGLLLIIYRKDVQIEQRLSIQFGTIKAKNNQPIKSIQNNNFFGRVLQPVFIYIRKKVRSRMSKNSMKDLDKRLRDAGRPFRFNAVDFRVAQVILSIVIFVGSFLILYILTFNILSTLLLAGALGGIIYIAPSFYLDSKKKKRIYLIERKMADFFDMVTLSIEAGMGFDQALLNVCRQTNGPIAEEFFVVLEDMKLGKSRREALFDLRNRIPSDLFQSIITSIIQAGELGIGMGNLMRSLTQRIREHQRETIREKAMKTPVKMLFPMIFFIFPSLFIVILGPFAVDVLVNGLF